MFSTHMSFKIKNYCMFYAKYNVLKNMLKKRTFPLFYILISKNWYVYTKLTEEQLVVLREPLAQEYPHR